MMVLLILAGVAISMLSGENAILNRAAEAKEKTEKAQENDRLTLIDTELISDFAIENTPYYFNDGYLTGISESKSVKAVEDELPENYEIYSIADKEIENKDKVNVGTGMLIKKNGKTIGEIVIFGDLNGDGLCNSSDITIMGTRKGLSIENLFNQSNHYTVIAQDLNADGVINWIDYKLRDLYKKNMWKYQDKKAAKVIASEDDRTSIDNYINSITDETTRAKFIWVKDDPEDEEKCNYSAESTDTVGSILQGIPNKKTIILRVEDGKESELKSSDPVKEGDTIILREEYEGKKLLLEIATITIQ